MMLIEPGIYNEVRLNGSTISAPELKRPEPVIISDPVQRPVPKIENRIISAVDALTKVPGLISDFGDRLNDRIISIADKSADKARENVTENKINSIARNAGKWLQTGNNLLYSAGAVLVLIFLIRKI